MARLSVPEDGTFDHLIETILPDLQPGETIVIIPLVLDKDIYSSIQILNSKKFPVDLIIPDDIESNDFSTFNDIQLRQIPVKTILTSE